jgi:hypothetical protein
MTLGNKNIDLSLSDDNTIEIIRHNNFNPNLFVILGQRIMIVKKFPSAQSKKANSNSYFARR